MEGGALAVEAEGTGGVVLCSFLHLANSQPQQALTVKMNHQFEAPDKKTLFPFGCLFYKIPN